MKAKKILALALCAVMLVCISVGATIAYLTDDTDVVVNTFTVGDVQIDLDEAKVNVYGEEEEGADRVIENTYKLIPGHTYTKDPIVYVTKGSEQCYVFVKITNDIAAIEDTTTIAAQMAANGWTELTGVTGVYYYNQIVDAREATADIQLKVFESFKIKGDVANDVVATYKDKTITVDAYAVQADGFNTAAEAWGVASTDWN